LEIGMTLLDWIENHLKEQHISATRFGRQVVGDPRFVLDLRNGRIPRRKTVARLESYLTERGIDRSDRGNPTAVVPDEAFACAIGGELGRDSNAARIGVCMGQAGLQSLRGEAARAAGSDGEAR
jgi:hypothetical protein